MILLIFVLHPCTFKHGATVAEIKTSAASSIQDNIGLLYGMPVQK